MSAVTNGHHHHHHPTSAQRATLHPSNLILDNGDTVPTTASNGDASSSSTPPLGPTASAYSIPICPICSIELNELALNVPYATHNKSHVDPDPVVLPNGKIYGSERLRRANEKMGTPKGRVRDPLDGKEFDEASVKKVFIS